eukprot:7164271-Prymnesium_polylepis.1
MHDARLLVLRQVGVRHVDLGRPQPPDLPLAKVVQADPQREADGDAVARPGRLASCCGGLGVR